MNQNDAKLIISSLKSYSAMASEVLEYIHKYDYRAEAASCNTQPTLIEVEHPTLYNLYIRLARYIMQIPHREDNLDRCRNLCYCARSGIESNVVFSSS